MENDDTATGAFSVQSPKLKRTYFLHLKVQTLRGGHTVNLYYFAAAIRPDAALAELPSDRVVVFAEKTGLPMLKKKGLTQ